MNIEKAVAVLNRALESDNSAITELVNHRVVCNETLANDPDVIVGLNAENKTHVGALGLINGLFSGSGYKIAVVMKEG